MASCHSRSFSFPSKSHPIVEKLDEQICRLRSSQAASTSSITQKLTGIKDLYKCVDEFLQLPQSRSQGGVDEVLDASLRLIDICATSQDVLVQSKERLLDLQSVLRRRFSGELNITKELSEYHSRSFSLPSTSHPVVDQLDEQLCRLKSSQAASTSSLAVNLTSLKDLYKCVDEFLQLPQSLHTNGIEYMLDGSLRLLDICSTSRDVLVQSKEQLQDLQSVLRRRYSGELNIANEFSEYLKTRKAAKKIIKRCLKDIQEVAKTSEANTTESKLKDVQAMTVEVFKSLLSYIGGSQKSNWSFSKFVRGQKAQKDVTEPISVFDEVNATVDLSQLIKIESEVQDIEEVLESLFRHLVKTRATLLNVLSH